MKELNKFTCRGITKDNKFVYGYAIYSELMSSLEIVQTRIKRTKEFSEAIVDNKTPYNVSDEILIRTPVTQEPDRFIGNFDGVDYFENDKLKIQNEDFLDENGDFNDLVKKIGNTHGIKEDL